MSTPPDDGPQRAADPGDVLREAAPPGHGAAMRHVLVRLGGIVLVLLFGTAAPVAAAVPDPAGTWPLAPRPEVVAGFDPPDTAYGAGHRGVDLAGRTGQEVRAALAGTVTHAGPLAGRGVVVVDHGGTRTTYEPVTASVEVGDALAAGDPIGTLDVLRSHCFPRACLHWGWIRGETYLDPLRLVGAEEPIRLLPLWRDVPPGSSTSGAGMGLAVGTTQPVGRDVGVALGGGQRSVAEQFLDRPQVRSPLEQVRRRGVP